MVHFLQTFDLTVAPIDHALSTRLQLRFETWIALSLGGGHGVGECVCDAAIVGEQCIAEFPIFSKQCDVERGAESL